MMTKLRKRAYRIVRRDHRWWATATIPFREDGHWYTKHEDCPVGADESLSEVARILADRHNIDPQWIDASQPREMIAQCDHKHSIELSEGGFTAPVSTENENRAAHGGIVRSHRCPHCGAHLAEAINGRHYESDGWQ